MRLAHLTDLHLPIPKPPALHELLGKRALGYLSWLRNRRHRHVRLALDRMVCDHDGQNPDFTVISGDIVNISLKTEFSAAVQWLERSFEADATALAPGNHDAYVPLPWIEGAGRFSTFMTGVRVTDSALRPPDGPNDFPFARSIGRVSLVVANSSPPTAPGFATGRLGRAQIERLKREMLHLKAAGHCRVLVVHHPITEGAASRRKALDDAADLRAVLAETGVELVLHGHTHFPLWASIATRDGRRPVVGGGSASHPNARGKYRPARYNLFTIEPDANGWRIDVAVRELDPATGDVKTVEERRLLPA